MLPFAPPVPWGLVAAAVIAVCVTAGGWYTIHGIRKADAVEIQQLAAVAEANRAAAARERAQAALSGRLREEATREHAETQKTTEAALARLQAQWDARPSDDPCRLCRFSWAEDGAEGGGPPLPE